MSSAAVAGENKLNPQPHDGLYTGCILYSLHLGLLIPAVSPFTITIILGPHNPKLYDGLYILGVY